MVWLAEILKSDPVGAFSECCEITVKFDDTFVRNIASMRLSNLPSPPIPGGENARHRPLHPRRERLAGRGAAAGAVDAARPRRDTVIPGPGVQCYMYSHIMSRCVSILHLLTVPVGYRPFSIVYLIVF